MREITGVLLIVLLVQALNLTQVAVGGPVSQEYFQAFQPHKGQKQFDAQSTMDLAWQFRIEE